MTGTPPRHTLLFALDRFDAEQSGGGERFAVDLGCGEGRDTAELLGRGWRVLAVDGQEEAIRRLRARPDLPPGATERLETLVCPMEAVHLPPALLVNASFALPFCPSEAFLRLWGRITASLLPGGRVSGQLFGVRDSWAAVAPRMTFHTRAEVEALLRPFVVEHLEEAEADGTTVEGKPKHWHLFHVIARKGNKEPQPRRRTMQRLGAGFITTNADVEALAFDWGTVRMLSEPSVTGAQRHSFGVVEVAPGGGHERHNHPGSEEIIYVLSGEGEQMVDDQPAVKIGPGACVFIPDGVYHATLNTGDEPMRLIIVYSPAGPERVLRDIPGCRVLAPGQTTPGGL